MSEAPRDFHGREIKAGDVIALAMVRGRSSAVLEQRFVRMVGEGYLLVQPEPTEPTDRRQIARVTNYRNSIVIT